MPKTKAQKKEIIRDIEEKIDKQKSIVFTAINGLKAKDLFDLRETLKKAECLLLVAKKTLFNIAFKDKKIDADIKKLEGEAALVFSFADEMSPAKILHQFSKKNENLRILGGLFEKKEITRDEVIALALLPSRQELYSKVVGSIQAPISGFVNVLQGNIRGLLQVLSTIKK